MRREYDFAKSRPNPYAERLKESVTIRLDREALRYFKELSATSGIPYQTLINLYLRDCASTGRKLDLQWKAPKRARSNKRLKLTARVN
jgi:antitoxin component of RelBE/YafQ-DinJ toxin-antitoxin module